MCCPLSIFGVMSRFHSRVRVIVPLPPELFSRLIYACPPLPIPCSGVVLLSLPTLPPGGIEIHRRA